MRKIIIAAVAENGVIGRENDIPWNYPEDMKHFRELTTGNPVVMGRNTYLSLPREYRPLPERTNIVLTRKDMDIDESVIQANSLEEAWRAARGRTGKVFIAGGASVYRQTIDQADEIELTRIHSSFEGDTYFPDWNPENWEEVNREDREELSFVQLRRG